MQDVLGLELCILLLNQTYDIDYALQCTILKQEINTIEGYLTNRAGWNLACGKCQDLDSETDHCIQGKEFLIDDTSLSQVLDGNKLWFTQMDILDSTYNQFFFIPNSLGCQLTTSQFFQPCTCHTLAPVGTAIHRALCEYATGNMAMVMFSREEYQGTCCPSPVIHFTQEAAVLIIPTLVRYCIP